MSKYGNRKTTIDGITFDSAAEARRYLVLKQRHADGDITNLVLQPRYELQPRFKRGKRVLRPIVYIADFQYEENGAVIAEDVKGVRTAVFDLKAKLFLYRYPDIDLRLVRA